MPEIFELLHSRSNGPSVFQAYIRVLKEKLVQENFQHPQLPEVDPFNSEVVAQEREICFYAHFDPHEKQSSTSISIQGGEWGQLQCIAALLNGCLPDGRIICSLDDSEREDAMEVLSMLGFKIEDGHLCPPVMAEIQDLAAVSNVEEQLEGLLSAADSWAIENIKNGHSIAPDLLHLVQPYRHRVRLETQAAMLSIAIQAHILGTGVGLGRG